MSPITLGDVIKQIRVPVVAKACGRSNRAIYKWIRNGCLPRTDWTGQTEYAKKIAQASYGQYSEAQILEISKPK